ncbi:hypothetical protein L1887_45083 [Cichorium endivia]|nr:hypothetical protein L1887_45083 [Cichorium endivia]
MRGIGVSHALADMSGFAFDRIFMVTEPDGTFITARQFPQMVRFTPSPLHDGLHLTAPDGSSAVIRFADFAPVDAPTEVWGRCKASVQMEQFRPNLVVTGADAWDEDTWKVIRIGSVIFDVVKPCSRCIFTTVSPEKGQKHPSGEPLKTLQSFRTAQDNGDVDFGQNLIPRSSGAIRVGDEVEILARGPARVYGSGQEEEMVDVVTNVASAVNIHWQGNVIRGNNQQVLLEQLEQAGIRVPYSCRAGICGCCRIKLVDGELHTENVRTAGSLNRLFEAEGIHAQLWLQPVIHHFNGIAKLHRPPGNGYAGLRQQAERSIFAWLNHQQAHLFCAQDRGIFLQRRNKAPHRQRKSPKGKTRPGLTFGGQNENETTCHWLNRASFGHARRKNTSASYRQV